MVEPAYVLTQPLALAADPTGTPPDGTRYYNTTRRVDRVYTELGGWQDVPAGRTIYTSPNGTRYELTVANDGTPSIQPYFVTLVADSFNRANETPLGTPDTGDPWQPAVGTGLSVISNQCGRVTAGTQGSVVDAGTADCVVVVTTAVAANGMQVVLRFTDINNYLYLQFTGDIKQVVGGVTTTLATMADGIASGRVYTFTLNGTSVHVTSNDALDSATTTTLLTGTWHGLLSTSSTARFDDFTVRSL